MHYGNSKGGVVSYSEALIRSAKKQITDLMANGSQMTPSGPVLLAHSNTSPYCLDKDLDESEASDIWRLNAGGGYHRPLDATVVTYRPRATNDPFSLRRLVKGEHPAERC